MIHYLLFLLDEPVQDLKISRVRLTTFLWSVVIAFIDYFFIQFNLFFAVDLITLLEDGLIEFFILLPKMVIF